MEGSSFGERLNARIRAKRSHVVVGLDPAYESLPKQVKDSHLLSKYADEAEMKAACYKDFLEGILDAVADQAVAVKIQLAYFEALGSSGYRLYEEMVTAARERELLVIADAKRGDIGSTAEAYAEAHLDKAGADAITVNPYLGTDSVEPFLKRARETDKGVFVLVKTSNPSSKDIQDLGLASGGPVYHAVARLVNEWGQGAKGGGYGPVGAVVGGTHPEEGRELRSLMPGIPFLVPGYGAQGAGADDLRGFFDAEGLGAVVNSSRGILYAYKKDAGQDWRVAAQAEAASMRVALQRASGLG